MMSSKYISSSSRFILYCLFSANLLMHSSPTLNAYSVASSNVSLSDLSIGEYIRYLPVSESGRIKTSIVSTAFPIAAPIALATSAFSGTCIFVLSFAPAFASHALAGAPIPISFLGFCSQFQEPWIFFQRINHLQNSHKVHPYQNLYSCCQNKVLP